MWFYFEGTSGRVSHDGSRKQMYVLVQGMLGTTSFPARCKRHWVMYS
jgi:hypothetical protein